jgi:hypothetical protein
MDFSYLFAALVWGSIGFGFFLYGRKMKRSPQLVGGILLIAISYLVKNPLNLSFISIALIAGIYLTGKRM